MAALQVKRHFNSTDVLFPEEPQLTLNDSFYSQPSVSGQSAYSQEVKYIFNPKRVTTSPATSQSEYSEIENFAANSNRASSELFGNHVHKESRLSLCSGGSPGGGSTSHKYSSTQFHNLPSPGPRRMSLDRSQAGSGEPQYGISVKPVALMQQRSYSHESQKSPWSSSRSTEHIHSPKVDNEPGAYRAEPEQKVYRIEQRLPTTTYRDTSPNMTQKYTVTSVLKPKTPPKPKRQLELNSNYPNQANGQNTIGPEIYSQPAPVSPMSKMSDRLQPRPPLPPLPPSPPPHQPYQQSKESAFDSFAARRRTWSPPTFERMMNQMGPKTLQAANRNYCSSEQLDSMTSTNTYEDLDNISNSSAPPKITPESGTLTKKPNERIIKPIAFKPVAVGQPSRYPPEHKNVSGPLLSPPVAGSSFPQAPQLNKPHPSSSQQAGGFRSQNVSVTLSSSHDRQANGSQSHESGFVAPRTLNTSLDPARSHEVSSHVSSPPGPPYRGGALANFYKSSGASSGSSGSYPSSTVSKISASSAGFDLCLTTPSPSDSGVGEMEAILRSKDAEIAQLRDTMEKNECAILQVYEKKRQSWQAEVREYADEWDRHMKAQQQKAFKTEQSLLMQIFKLQQERKTLKEQSDEQQSDKDTLDKKCHDLNRELASTKSRAEELQWEVHNKGGEVNMLKTQLKEAKDELSAAHASTGELHGQISNLAKVRDEQATQIREQESQIALSQDDFRQLQIKLDETRLKLETHLKLEEESKLKRPPPPPVPPPPPPAPSEPTNNNVNDTVAALEMELCKLRTEFGTAKTSFQEEREQWLEEKSKVVRYQKHLQLNYVQMMRKNKMLESDIEQLTLELENRDINLLSDGRVAEEESMC